MVDTLTAKKAWYTSKTIWAAAVAAIIAVYNTLAPQFGWPVIPDLVYTILAALGIYSRVSATQKIG